MQHSQSPLVPKGGIITVTGLPGDLGDIPPVKGWAEHAVVLKDSPPVLIAFQMGAQHAAEAE